MVATVTPDALATAVERLRAKAKYIDVESGSPDDWWADAIENMVTVLRALPVEQRMEAMGMERCTKCEGMGWIEDDAGAVPCPHTYLKAVNE